MSPLQAPEERWFRSKRRGARNRSRIRLGLPPLQRANPNGFIIYGNDGRMLVLIVRRDRPKPESLDKITDQQRADLHRSMTAYGGTYKFDGKRVEHNIDISWNEVFTGTVLVREITKDGDRLIYTSPPARFSGDGRMSQNTLVWEKVTSYR
jgi:Lipocalin-like domain